MNLRKISVLSSAFDFAKLIILLIELTSIGVEVETTFMPEILTESLLSKSLCNKYPRARNTIVIMRNIMTITGQSV